MAKLELRYKHERGKMKKKGKGKHGLQCVWTMCSKYTNSIISSVANITERAYVITQTHCSHLNSGFNTSSLFTLQFRLTYKNICKVTSAHYGRLHTPY